MTDLQVPPRQTLSSSSSNPPPSLPSRTADVTDLKVPPGQTLSYELIKQTLEQTKPAVLFLCQVRQRQVWGGGAAGGWTEVWLQAVHIFARCIGLGVGPPFGIPPSSSESMAVEAVPSRHALCCDSEIQRSETAPVPTPPAGRVLDGNTPEPGWTGRAVQEDGDAAVGGCSLLTGGCAGKCGGPQGAEDAGGAVADQEPSSWEWIVWKEMQGPRVLEQLVRPSLHSSPSRPVHYTAVC